MIAARTPEDARGGAELRAASFVSLPGKKRELDLLITCSRNGHRGELRLGEPNTLPCAAKYRTLHLVPRHDLKA